MFSTAFLLFIKFILIGDPEIVYPKDYFGAPLDGTLLLSGNFGELRTNHFHSGIDFKTDGQVGKKVYSSAHGEVARIKISTSGYGKCIYIKHSNGFTTVYAHLQKFTPELEKLIKNEQYRLKSYEIDFTLHADEIKLTKRQLIGYSGNTGGSGGPHLHFEIRNTATEEPLNPLLFGFNVLDNIAPVIKGIRIYPINDSSFVDGYSQPKSFEVILPKNSKNNHIISQKQSIIVSGKIGFAINTLDKINNATSRCGIYSIKLEVDNSIIYEDKLEKINFDTWRYVNAYTDYELFVRKKMNYHKNFVTGNNKLAIYKTLLKNGIIEFNDEQVHTIKYTVKDVFGNTSTLVFNVTSSRTKLNPQQTLSETADKYFSFDKEGIFSNQSMGVKIPAFALYQNLAFNCTEMGENSKSLSPVWAVQNQYVPLQSSIELKIKPDVAYKAKSNQLGIVQILGDNSPKWLGGSFKENELTVATKNFGTFCIMADTVAPTISPVLDKKKNLVLNNIITFKIKDNLSGIKNYNVNIDGSWIVAEYEFKNNAIYCYLQNLALTKGNHKIEASIEDNANNKVSYEGVFLTN
jgi:Peptidase family M23